MSFARPSATAAAARLKTLLAALTFVMLGAPAGANDAVNPAVITGDAAKGALAFERNCALCHNADKDGPNAFGPNLFGVIDRKAATVAGYEYSPAFKAAANWTWSPDGIASFIIAPGATVPANKMSPFQGVSDKDLDDILAFLSTRR